MVFLNFLLFAIIFSGFFWLEKIGVSRLKRNIIAIFLGISVGFFIQFFLKSNGATLVQLFQILGTIYLRFLQMLTFPVVSIAILMAFLHIGDVKNATKSPIYIILILLCLTAISATVGYFSVVIFKLDATALSDVIMTATDVGKLQNRQEILNRPLQEIITTFIPTNPFLDLTGARPSSLASTVIFFTLIGFAYLIFKKTEPQNALKVKSFIEICYKIIMILVNFALKLTPYGALGLLVKVSATLDILTISKLLNFVLVSYLAIFIMFLIHTILITFAGINPISYYKKTFELLSFGFLSRSSSAAIPLNIEIQVEKFNISPQNATVSSAFGSTIGQNGCAGIYPAMLISMVGFAMGIDIFSLKFVLYLVMIVTINSLGIAGVGGGAIFAAIAGLQAFGMPITIVALLAGIEPIIDMARTALNINGTVVSSILAEKFTKQYNF